MRLRLPALALLLAAGPALAQPAPPSAADSALVERYVALADGVALSDALADAPGPASALTRIARPEATRDSIRAVLYADLRPGLLAEAVAFAESPLSERAQSQSGLSADSLSFADVQSLIANPGDRPLADSALAARYVAAFLGATQPPEVRARMADLLVGALPPPPCWTRWAGRTRPGA